jgi:hypothetical protein
MTLSLVLEGEKPEAVQKCLKFQCKFFWFRLKCIVEFEGKIDRGYETQFNAGANEHPITHRVKISTIDTKYDI